MGISTRSGLKTNLDSQCFNNNKYIHQKLKLDVSIEMIKEIRNRIEKNKQKVNLALS